MTQQLLMMICLSTQGSHQILVRGTEKERRMDTSQKRRRLPALLQMPNPKGRNPMLPNQPKTTIPSRRRSQRRKRQRRAQVEVKRNNPSQRQGRAVRADKEPKRFQTPPELRLKPFQTPRHRLRRLQVASRSRTRNLTAFMVSSKGPNTDRSSTRS